MKDIDVVVTGHLCLDIIPAMSHVSVTSLTRPGHLLEVGPASVSTGGAVSNTGLALHRLGANVRLMASVGDDPIGHLIMASLKEQNSQLAEFIHIKEGQSSSYTIALSPGGADRTFLHCTGTNATFDATSIDFSIVKRAKCFHLGYPTLLPNLLGDSGYPLLIAFQQAKAAGAVTSLDMTMPDPDAVSGKAKWKIILRRTLPYVDIFMPSIEEILFMLRREDYDAWQGQLLSHLTRGYLADLADELIAMGTLIAGFKLGEMGLYLRTAKERLPHRWSGIEVWSPAFQVEVKGTTGAGDAAYAGLLAAWLKGLSPQECAKWACAVGACCVESPDATSGIRSWEQTRVRMSEGWQIRPAYLVGF